MATLDEHARAAIAAITDKKFEDALRHFREALALDPTRPDLIHGVGMAHLHRGEAIVALPYLEQSVEAAKTYTDERYDGIRQSFYIGLANAYEMLDRVLDARKTLEQALEIWPDALEPKLQLGQLLLAAGEIQAGMRVYRELADHPRLDPDSKKAAETVAAATQAFLDSDHPAGTFLQAHAQSYKDYFDEAVAESVKSGWLAEATRMVRGPDGEPKATITQGARPYAMMRIDIVNPTDGTAASVYSEQEPMVVALNGLEPLAQLSIVFPWKDQEVPTFVSSRCPWHWLQISIQFERPMDEETRINAIDPVMADWYLAGFNGDFGSKESGRFHFITNPEPVGTRAVVYTVDLGRASFDAIPALLRRLGVLNTQHPIRRVQFGQAKLLD